MLARTSGWMIVAILSLVTLGGCYGGNAPIEDTPELRDEMARRIVRLEIESGDLDHRLDRGAELAQAYSLDTLRLELGRELTDQELDRVLEVMRSVLGEFLTEEVWADLLTEVYVEHFTANEIKEVVEFFESQTGKKVLKLSGQLADEVDAKSDVIFEGQMDAFVNRIDEELGKVFPGLQEDES